MNYIKNLVARSRMLIAMAIASFVALVFVGAPASAAPTLPPVPDDPTGGAMSTTLTGVIDWVTTYGVPALAVGILTGILIRLGFKWVRRAGRAIG